MKPQQITAIAALWSCRHKRSDSSEVSLEVRTCHRLRLLIQSKGKLIRRVPTTWTTQAQAELRRRSWTPERNSFGDEHF